MGFWSQLTELLQGVSLIYHTDKILHAESVATTGYFLFTYAFSVDWFEFSALSCFRAVNAKKDARLSSFSLAFALYLSLFRSKQHNSIFQLHILIIMLLLLLLLCEFFNSFNNHTHTLNSGSHFLVVRANYHHHQHILAGPTQPGNPTTKLLPSPPPIFFRLKTKTRRKTKHKEENMFFCFWRCFFMFVGLLNCLPFPLISV